MVDNVFRFEIAMNDFVLVHVVQSSADLLHDILGHILWDFSLFLQEVVQLSWKAELKHQVDIVLVGEEGEHFDNVGVVQETLDLYLSHQLHY